MHLQDLKLIESSAVNIFFNQNVTSSGQGSIKVEYGTVEFEVGGHLTDNPETTVVALKATPCIRGFRKDIEHVEGQEDFILKIEIRMLYAFDSKLELSEKFIQENSWYFSSFLRAYFRQYAEDILKNTTLNGIKLQAN
ncbi:hypothetical protein ACYB9B_24010 [Klebsiella pneumoniae]|uniref:hypothetical protein n=1 Tax=Klebsiella TaxID=570 RepID=UPI0006523DC0|nr:MULTISPECIES: hypothetical protein [Klebsiella]EKZ6087197.1 hypothetical protein [Klebsiella pneumoniae]ELA2117189.1 hypothetical protein [Klebsiella pneumoniae]MCA5546270.1 hypothetical protein [Klebsiella pneumoniae]MCD9767894.1 hypothetical protein [Klebsiella variicola subsp. variicola]MCD9914374.1 hypothetical protein [Klebsiella variicola subsp. variicola]